MATSNSKARLFATQSPFFALLAFLMVFFVLLLNKVNASDFLSFNFAKFGPDPRDIIFQGDAQQSGGALQLIKTDKSGNPVKWSAGRASYTTPLHLWEGKVGRLASFETCFTFLIEPSGDYPGDGFTFFIAQPESDVGKAGGLLGLFKSSDPSDQNQIVAIEFDSFTNTWDPNPTPGIIYPHLGIDVNSIESTAYTGWPMKDVMSGLVATAQVRYDSIQKALVANLSYSNSMDVITLQYGIDLRYVLPEWVRVGFSAATGDVVETHNILSWSFTSQFENSTAEMMMFDSSVAM